MQIREFLREMLDNLARFVLFSRFETKDGEGAPPRGKPRILRDEGAHRGLQLAKPPLLPSQHRQLQRVERKRVRVLLTLPHDQRLLNRALGIVETSYEDQIRARPNLRRPEVISMTDLRSRPRVPAERRGGAGGIPQVQQLHHPQHLPLQREQLIAAALGQLHRLRGHR